MVGNGSSSSPGRVFDTPDTMPDAPNSGSNRKSQPAGLGNQVKALLRTPCAAEAEGGMLHPDKAEREGQTLRLSSQIVHMVAPDQLKDDLLPTPCASPSGNTPEEHLRKKPGRERVTDLSILVENDLMQSGGKLLPTPSTIDGKPVDVKNQVTTRNSPGLQCMPALLGMPEDVWPDTDMTGNADRQVGAAERRRKLLPTPRASDGEKGGPNQRGSKGDLTMASAVHQQFGPYADAIARWEGVIGREAPAPTGLTAKGKHSLSARFVEWMMGQSDGWVTDEELGLSRVQQLRALGNGVVTQQAVFAIEWLLVRAGIRLAS